MLATLVHVADGSSLLSHCTTEPVRPASVRVVLDPIQIGVVPETVPPTVSGLTVTSNVLEGEGQLGSVVYRFNNTDSARPGSTSDINGDLACSLP